MFFYGFAGFINGPQNLTYFNFKLFPISTDAYTWTAPLFPPFFSVDEFASMDSI